MSADARKNRVFITLSIMTITFQVKNGQHIHSDEPDQVDERSHRATKERGKTI